MIVGGGTAGLALANRLTENPKINVGVLEAVRIFDISVLKKRLILLTQGENHIDDPYVLIPGLFNSIWWNESYDWVSYSVLKLFI